MDKILRNYLDNDLNTEGIDSQEDLLQLVFDFGKNVGVSEKITEDIFSKKLEWILEEYAKWISYGNKTEAYGDWRKRILNEVKKS